MGVQSISWRGVVVGSCSDIENILNLRDNLTQALTALRTELENNIKAIQSQISAIVGEGGDGEFAIPSVDEIMENIDPEALITQAIVDIFMTLVQVILAAIDGILGVIKSLICELFDIV